MDVDARIEDDNIPDADMEVDPDVDAVDLIPMASSSDITALREKLHAKMASLRRGGANDAGDRDVLLEERRQQRAAMRERRRKETKEKIRREEASKGKKAKDRQKKEAIQTQAKTTKVSSFFSYISRLETQFIRP